MDSSLGWQSYQNYRKVGKETEIKLRSAMKTHMDDETRQISHPRLLQLILDKDEIRKLFGQYESEIPWWKGRDIDKLSQEVHSKHIRVLAILILFEMGPVIVHLWDNGVSDDKLPLIYNDELCANDLHLAGQRDIQLTCFDNENTETRKEICRTQWYLNVPYLAPLSETESDFRLKHENFDSNVVLPWCRPVPLDSGIVPSAKIEHSGGYSSVRMVHIDSEYHGFHGIFKKIKLRSSNNFALKILNPQPDQELERMYQNEIRQLSHFNGTVSRHLVTLLATFTQKEKRHFLFPWATCDLFSYWETENMQPWDIGHVRWFSKQLLGLVQAVRALHWSRSKEHYYARHGDLKPDNILWYKGYADDDEKGILVVSDMGFTVAHTMYSRSKDLAAGVARTPEYRPPELDDQDAKVSRSYDIWTLGCIFLEMLIWFLGGNNERIEFKKSRGMVDSRGAGTFTFFTLNQKGNSTSANVKPSVVMGMNAIRNHRHRTEFSDNVVDAIEKSMIVVDPKKRCDIKDLEQTFVRINDNCQKSEDYGIGPAAPLNNS
ncbi:kinase-like domain-containing protein [Xylaria telfairii]|nr:kinase-like domain-containing protein [Xylaria telfairii]